MTATDELRRLLDKRGVEWDYGITGATSTRFGANGVDVTFVPSRDGLVCSTILTPAQAVKIMLERGWCSYAQWRAISGAVGDAMEYAHDKAVEFPDKADPLWNLDEYVNRIVEVVFEGKDTFERGECEQVIVDCNDGLLPPFTAHCSACGEEWGFTPRFCPNCGRKVKR